MVNALRSFFTAFFKANISGRIRSQKRINQSLRALYSIPGPHTDAASKSLSRQTRQELHQIRTLKKKLEMGFEKRALSELNHYVQHSEFSESRAEAAWLMANWKLNENFDEHLPEVQSCLDLVCSVRPSPVHPAALAVIQIECLLRQGKWEKARDICRAALEQEPDCLDLKLAAANLYSSPHCPAQACTGQRQVQGLTQSLHWLNQVLRADGLEEVSLARPEAGLSLDNLQVEIPGSAYIEQGPLITVIMAAHNAEDHLQTSLSSVLNQTWQNIEVIVIDDASTDGTPALARDMAALDKRVVVLETGANVGPYIARNMALEKAQGDFVTLHDADDWSHPRKLERQIRHLLDDTSIVATRSEHARATTDLVFDRRGHFGFYVFPNMSSLMFHRKRILEQIGFWDAVLFAGDSEFLKRIKHAFGREAVRDCQTGLVCILREHASSLTACAYTGYRGYKKGARWIYDQGVLQWHDFVKRPYMPHPLTVRPFSIPSVMLPSSKRAHSKEDDSHVDVVLASDFRMQGGTTASNIQEIKAQRREGLKTGLVQLNRYNMNTRHRINRKLLELVDGEYVFWICPGSQVSADTAILRYPLAIAEKQDLLPCLEVKNLCLICNQAPWRGWNKDSERLYEPEQVDYNARQVFGVSPTWYPIGPQARQGLEKENANIRIAQEDWVNIIDVDQWSDYRTGPVNNILVIGRHGRDYPDKWPPDARSILTVYPERDDLVISILGGAEKAVEKIGYKPGNWEIHGFDAISPQEYLCQVDVFVYFPDPNRNEAFGRTIFEAMAVGVPVILPPRFQAAFAEAALYCEPEDAVNLALSLYTDQELYGERVRAGREYVRRNFGYQRHIQRLQRLSGTKSSTPQPGVLCNPAYPS